MYRSCIKTCSEARKPNTVTWYKEKQTTEKSLLPLNFILTDEYGIRNSREKSKFWVSGMNFVLCGLEIIYAIINFFYRKVQKSLENL